MLKAANVEIGRAHDPGRQRPGPQRWWWEMWLLSRRQPMREPRRSKPSAASWSSVHVIARPHADVDSILPRKSK